MENTELLPAVTAKHAVMDLEQQPQSPGLRDPEALIRFAIERSANVETLERLMAIRREVRLEQAKEAYDHAMALFQSQCPTIIKDKGVPTRTGEIAFKYAPLESIVAQVKPLLLEHGFSYALDTDVESKEGWVIAKCKVTHSMGHSEESIAKFPLGTKTAIMSDTQAYAAALTFASRRVFCNAFGIIPAGEDMESRLCAKQKPRGPSSMAAEPTVKELAQEAWNLLKPVRGTEKNWNLANQWLWKEELLDGAIPEEAPQLSPERFKKLLEALRKHPELNKS